jgi:hypothetical protein
MGVFMKQMKQDIRDMAERVGSLESGSTVITEGMNKNRERVQTNQLGFRR